MKARIDLAKFPEGRPGYYAMIENEAQYERVLNADLSYEKSKRVTHYLVPASVFERLLALDKCREKLVGKWVTEVGEKVDGKPIRSGRHPWGTVYCSACDGEAHKINDEYIYDSFCPHCGADMRSDFDKEETEDEVDG